jgi:uncharacterized membrane protein YhaH (DUF805 family)
MNLIFDSCILLDFYLAIYYSSILSFLTRITFVKRALSLAIHGFFGFQGRMSQLYYVAMTIMVWMASMLLVIFAVSLGVEFNHRAVILASTPHHPVSVPVTSWTLSHSQARLDLTVALLGIDGVGFLWAACAMAAKRLRDMGWSPWHYAWMLVVVVGPGIVSVFASSLAAQRGWNTTADVAAALVTLTLMFWPSRKPSTASA